MSVIAKYKFDKSIYENLIPVFNDGYTGYTISDEIDGNIVTRTIECNTLPTLMRFGCGWSGTDNSTNREKSLISVLDMNLQGLETAYCMFYSCINLVSVYSSSTSNNFMNTANMFQYCSKLTSIDIKKLVTNKVIDTNCMFLGCHKLTSLDVSDFDTSNVTRMDSMFSYCYNLTELNVSNFNTSKVTSMSNMFLNCQLLVELNTSKWDTSKVTTMNRMFNNCYNLTKLDVSNWDTGNVTDMSYMFYSCTSLTELDLNNFNTSNVTDMIGMFLSCNKLASLDVSNWDTSNVTTMQNMFENCNNLTSLNVSNWDTSNVINMYKTFRACEKLTSLDVSNWNTSNVTTMYCMFSRCQNLTSLDVSNWNTSNVNYMYSMFWGCNKLTSLDVSNFDTSKVINMAGMFCYCYNLTSLDVSNFKTTKIIEGKEHPEDSGLSEMFRRCNKLKSLDISNFSINPAHDNSAGRLFLENTSIEDIGMIYCDFKTIKMAASAVPTTNPTTIWVGNHIDFNALPQYDHITYKVYEVEDKLEVELSNPLLEGDRLEIIDGDLYHYHKMKEFYIDKEWGFNYGSEESGWRQFDTNVAFYTYGKSYGEQYTKDLKHKGDLISDQFNTLDYEDIIHNDCEAIGERHGTGYIGIRINKNRLTSVDITGMHDYVTKNPIHVIAELANPYYELVKPNVGLLNAKQGLYLSISDSVVPINYQFDLCITKLNYLLSNTQYKVSFKANEEGTISLNLGGTLSPLDVTKGFNEVLITTSKTLEHQYLKINGSSNIKISNIMVIDSEKDFNYFKGMNNNFDEIPVNNICSHRTLTYLHGTDEEGKSPQYELTKDVNKGKLLTVVGKVSNNPNDLPISINLYKDTAYELPEFNVNDEPVYIESTTALVDEGEVDISTTDGYFTTTIRADRDYVNRIGFNVKNASTLEVGDTVQITDLMVFEGDFTDCYPTTWQDFDETRYLAEFISYNNEFGFGKNRLI